MHTHFYTWTKVNKTNILIFFFGIFVLFGLPTDPDFGWHLKYGEYLFTNGRLLRENIHSFTFADYQWANSYWLAQAIFYSFVYLFGEIYGPIIMSLIFSILLSLLVVYLFSKLAISNTAKILSASLLLVIFGAFHITTRPMYFSSVFLLMLVYVLLFEDKYIKYTPLLFLAWANLHAGFVIGLFVFGTYTFFEFFDIKSRKFKRDSSLPFLIFSGLATLITPFFTDLHRTLLKETNPFQFKYISEWAHAGAGETEPTWYLFYFLIVALLLICMFRTRKSFGIWYPVVVVIFSLLSIRSVYFLRVAMIMGVFAVTFCVNDSLTNLRSMFGFFSSKQQSKILKTIRIGAYVIFAVAAVIFVEDVYLATDVEKWSSEGELPYGAIEYIKENELEGNMFNYYSWGGYLIWKLPEKKTFVDGRMPSWREDGNSLFEDYIKIMENPSENNSLLNYYWEKYNIKIVLIPPESKLGEVLVEDLGMKVVYEDESSELFSK